MERHRVMLGNVDPDLWARVKAEAALARKPIAKWVEEALWEAVEDAEDVRDALESMKDREGTVTLEEYMARDGAVHPQSAASRAKEPGRPSTKHKGTRSRRTAAA